jgi:ABC-2 type transport system ATP-binding protein
VTAIEVRDLTKRFGNVVAVDALSFDVGSGEVFGLLGPNGAGKTTTIRIIMDILSPDGGEVTLMGRSPAQAKRDVGYLPEERGLYRNLRVLETLVYLAELKGVRRAEARERARLLLEGIGAADWAGRRVRELSKGMQQRVQFIASLVHDPEVVFLDEPFQGLDPVNVERVKDSIVELHDKGKTVVLSTHQMNLVEALCDRILLIHNGRALLYGRLEQIKRQHAPNTVRVRASDLPAGLHGVSEVSVEDGAYNLVLEDGVGPQELLRALVDQSVELQSFEVAPVPLGDIFVSVVGGREG